MPVNPWRAVRRSCGGSLPIAWVTHIAQASSQLVHPFADEGRARMLAPARQEGAGAGG